MVKYGLFPASPDPSSKHKTKNQKNEKTLKIKKTLKTQKNPVHIFLLFFIAKIERKDLKIGTGILHQNIPETCYQLTKNGAHLSD